MSSSTSTSSHISNMQSSPAVTISRPISFSSSACSHRSSISSTTTSTSNPYSTCAYPSWPSGASFLKTSYQTPSAYVSDEDLFGDDDAYLSEPPPPPRPAEAYLAKPLLPPITQFKPRQCSTAPRRKKRSSSLKPKD